MGTAGQNAGDSLQPQALSVPPLSVFGEIPARPKRRYLRSLIHTKVRRPPRAALERACRIALMEVMEVEEAASVETIYDHIVRRGSLSFYGYKRPLRAISSAMSALVKRGEALLLTNVNRCWRMGGRQRLWRKAMSELPSERAKYCKP
jgi:hypothetical protein